MNMMMSSEKSNKECLEIGIETLKSNGFVKDGDVYRKGNIEWYFDVEARWYWRYTK